MHKFNDDELQLLSRALTHLIFRNSIIEDFHSELPDLSDEVMCALNKDINNRIYTLLNLWFDKTPESQERLNNLIKFSAMFGSNWDKARLLDDSDF